ncbi:DUF2807 domain-containing protein [Undibacterium sp. Jales W-56]|uniref:head GIN domain-containing protein n=1 Tax=Undibacterium sp. Jales W-56 TaxID=2897325 RepID=UPI0021CED3F2|nr:head GIN domain-containing protein [Undibacterium sp. Jales W-56]MCU6435631.1 DUF2807 domain-containing protein [Undibacterium sp. Jales W-56]
MITLTRFAHRICVIGLASGAIGLVTYTPVASAADWSWSWGSGKHIAGSGKVQLENRAVSQFNAISIGLPANVELQQGTSEGISIETDDNLLALIETVVDNGTLKIRPVEKHTNFDTRTMKIVIRLKQIDELDVGGSGSIHADKLQAAKLRVTLGGAGAVTLQGLNADSLALSVGGSGSFKVAGTASTVSMNIGGSGSIDGAALKANDTKISIGGSGRISTTTRDNLKVSIGGSGTVTYYGDPQVSKSIGGSGSVVRAGNFPS